MTIDVPHSYNSSGRLFPNALIIGVQKASTSWLSARLAQHPDAFVVRGEVHFFDQPKNYAKGPDWYASREVVDLLNLEYGFMAHETVADLRGGQQAGVKRWLKERVYARLPGGLRAFAYFVYRYVIRLGFLDGKEGTAFHVLQGFWYRYLVDMKLHEVKTYMQFHDADVVDAIRDVLGITIHVDATDRD